MAILSNNFKHTISFFLLVVCLCFFGSAHAQESSSKLLKYIRIHEIGIGLGGMNYQGDVSPGYKFQNYRPAGTIFYKKVISQPFSIRAALTGGFAAANDKQYSKIPFQQDRKTSINTQIIELGVGIEYNFLDFYDFKRLTRWTPYFCATPAFFYYRTHRDDGPTNNNDNSATDVGYRFAFGLGPGVKLALSRKWNLGVETGPRLVLNRDFLDDLTETTDKGKQLSNPYNRDWYFFTGITLSYTIYQNYCPDVYKKNLNILN